MKMLIRNSVSRPRSTLLFFLAVSAGGGLSLFYLPREFYPEVKVPKMIVSTSFPSASAMDTRELVTIPIEDSLSPLKGLKSIRSITRSGTSTLELNFHWGTDMVLAAIRAREKLDLRYPFLPEGVELPKVLSVDPNQQPLMIIGVFPRSGDLTEGRRIAERELKTELHQIPGTGVIILKGGTGMEIGVTPSREKLLNLGFTSLALAETIKSNNFSFPAGAIKEGSMEYVVKTEGEFKNIGDLKSVNIPSSSGTPFPLSTAASVGIKEKKQESFFFYNQTEGTAIVLRKGEGVNPVKLCRDVKRKLLEWERRYKNDLEFAVLSDSSEKITSTARALGIGVITGSLIAFIVVLLFFRDWVLGLILISSIPASISMTMLLFAGFKISLNTMSLGGMALGIGMLVDNSVVVLDSLIVQAGSRNYEAVSDAVSSVGRCTFTSTVTSVIVFVPLFFLPGILKEFYRDLGFAVVFSLTASYFVSITLVPVLFSLYTSRLPYKGKCSLIYIKFLGAALRKPKMSIFIILLLSAALMLPLAGLSTSFMPEIPEKTLNLSIPFPPGTNLELIKIASFDLSRGLKDLEVVKDVFGSAGGEKDDLFFRSDLYEAPSILHLTLLLNSPITGGQAPALLTIEGLIKKYLKDKGHRIISIDIKTPGDPLSDLFGVKGKERSFIVSGSTQKIAAEEGRRLVRLLSAKNIPASIIPSENIPEIHITPDRKKLLLLGYSVLDLTGIVRTILTGRQAGSMQISGRIYPITVYGGERKPVSEEEIASINIPVINGESTALGNVASVNRISTPAGLLRIGRKDAVLLTVPDLGKKGLKFVETLVCRPPCSLYPLPSLLEEQKNRIIFLFFIALSLLYLFLGAVFESFTEPVIILSVIPISTGGVVTALYFSGETINVQSIMGALVLLGLIVNNSILLKDAVHRRSLQTGTKIEKLVDSMEERFRSVLITSTTTIFALLPTASSIFGSTPQKSLSVSILGGLVLSTGISLFFLPLLSLKTKAIE